MNTQKIFNLGIVAMGMAVMVGCGGTTNEYTLKGQLSAETFDGKTVYVRNMEDGTIMDSAVVADGAFEMKGTIDTPVIVKLTVNGDNNMRYYTECILEGGKITADIIDSRLEGTSMNEALSDMLHVCDTEKKAMEDLYAKYRQAETEEVRKQVEIDYDSINAIYIEKYSKNTSEVYAANKDNVLGAFAMYNCLSLAKEKGMNVAQMDSILNGASEIVLNYGPTQKIIKEVQNLEKTSVGQRYIDVDLLMGEKQEATKLSQHIDGKVALIDFWASWCGPCRNEIPFIAEMHKKYENKGLVVIGLNVWDKPEAQQKLIAEKEMTWLQLADTTRIATEVYGVSAIPQIMLIDKDGTIVARNLRGEAIEEAILKVIE